MRTTSVANVVQNLLAPDYLIAQGRRVVFGVLQRCESADLSFDLEAAVLVCATRKGCNGLGGHPIVMDQARSRRGLLTDVDSCVLRI